MCAKLLILESPGKVKKVQEILGPGWKVAASVGHVRDLPVKEMGVAALEFCGGKTVRWPGAKPGCAPSGGARKGNQRIFQHNALRRRIDL